MRANMLAIAGYFALLVVIGCASNEVIERKSHVGDQKIVRPDRISVFDFAATPSDVPSDIVLAIVITAVHG